MNTKEAIKLIQSEINWCLDHPDETLSHDAQFGFMNGLRQAQYLLRKASQPAQDACICTQLTALEPTVNPDCSVHGSLKG